MKQSSKTFIFIATLVFFTGNACGEDIDIFSGVGSGGSKPNVLIIVDNTSSNDSAYSSACPYSAAPPSLPNGNLLDMVYCALYGTVDAIKTQPALLGKLNIGLMSGGSGSNKGGQMFYPASAPYNLPLMDAAGIANFQSIIAAGIPKATGNAKLDGDMQEAWAFYTGNTGPRSGTSYSAHIGTLSCQKSFIIVIGAAQKNGRPNNGTGYGSASELAAAGATAAQQVQINTSNLGPYTTQDISWTDEWARFLYQNDFNNSANDRQNVVTYTIAAGGDVADYVQLLHSTANRGGGKAFVGSNYAAMVQALLQIFNEVAAVNSAFASSSLPISANSQGTYLNQVFVGMFRPEVTDLPRWTGNLKQYQFGVDASNPASLQLFLADATGAKAISSAGTGFIAPTAVSFWTQKNTTKLPDSIGGFWIGNPQGSAQGFDLPDGEMVEKGGAGQQLRLSNLTDNYSTNPTTPRNLYTCISATGMCAANSSLSSSEFATNNANITAAILGTNGPPMAISNITRSGTTATVTLASAPTPVLTSGQSVTIAGSQYTEFNGTVAITPVTATTFTYSVTVDPPTPATGTYAATVPSNLKTVASLTRSGTTVTATVNGHGYVTGQTVTITGATGAGYKGSFVITNTGANTFTYTITDGPPTPDGGGTAKVGGNTLVISPSPSGIVRNPSNPSNVSEVTVTVSVNVPFAVGNTVVISGAGGGVSPYNGSWAITKLGTSCMGGSKSGNNPRSFCFNFNSTPVSPDPSVSTKADGVTIPLAITGLTHVASTCASNSTVLVTAGTSAAPTFVAGETVSVGGTAGPNENLYVGSFPVMSVKTTSPFNFTYNINASPGNGTSCTDATSGMTASAQGVSRDSLIRWVRGEDNIGDEASPGNGITVRPSVHGDVVHSRPIVINYGVSTGVVVFYGANDGVFHAVNGNQTASIGGVPPGGELWAFVPQEFFSKLQRLYSNSPQLKLANTPTGITPTPTPKDYYFDGATGVYQNGSTAYIFLSARRGGRLIYALDVSDPANPKFMWKKGCPNLGNNTGCDAGYSELGETWSQPKVALVKGWTNPVLIFGAGNDPNEEDNDPPSAGDTMGRGIFIVDATNGSVVWQAGPGGGSNTCQGTPCKLLDMTFAIAADITLVNRSFDSGGNIDRLYAADTGGNIWRVDLQPTGGNAPANWQVTKFAALGGTGSTAFQKRKFLYPPDVVLTSNFDAIMAATGDREHPLFTNNSLRIVNRFYMIKDTKVGLDASGWTTVADSTSNTADTAPASLFHVTTQYNSDGSVVATNTYAGSLSGFYVTLAAAGEKAVNAPATIGGSTYFATNQPTDPSTLSCSNNLGIARGYQINFVTGSTAAGEYDGGGLPPSPVTGLVTVQVNGQPTLVPFLLGGNPGGANCSGPDCKSSLGGNKPAIPISPTRSRVYWYTQKHDN
jgi:type IV pilus assembly protein PilY1